jgi:hypothetical protein
VTRPRRLATLLLVAPALAVGACGGASDEEQIKAVIQGIAQDVATICGHASERFLDEQLGGDQAACEARARSAPDDSSESIESGAIDVTVDGDSATADFTDNEGKDTHVTFVKDGDEWLVDASE